MAGRGGRRSLAFLAGPTEAHLRADEEVRKALADVSDDFLVDFLAGEGVHAVNRAHAVQEIAARFADRVPWIVETGAKAAGAEAVVPTSDGDGSVGVDSPAPAPTPGRRPRGQRHQSMVQGPLRDWETEVGTITRMPVDRADREQVQQVMAHFVEACRRETRRQSRLGDAGVDRQYKVAPELKAAVLDVGTSSRLGMIRLLRAALDTVLECVEKRLPILQRELGKTDPTPFAAMVGVARSEHGGQAPVNLVLSRETVEKLDRLCKAAVVYPSDVVGWAAEQAVTLVGMVDESPRHG